MQSLDYLTCTELACIQTSQAPIVLCIDPAVSLVSGGHTVPAILLISTEVAEGCNCASGYWRYTVAYDETLLTDPASLLTPDQVKGIFCESCFTDWIREIIAKMILESS